MQELDLDNYVRPFIKWVGGKSRNIRHLLKYVPSCVDTYVEPFVGSGALFFAMKFKKAIINDSNEDLIAAYRQIKKDPETLKKILKTFVYDKEMFLEVRAWDRDDDYKSRPEVERAARLIYLVKTCFNGLYRVSSKGYFNTPFGRLVNPTICNDLALDSCSNYLNNHDVDIHCKDFLELESLIPDNAFVYFDPPYVPLSSSSSFTAYQKEMFGYDMQVALRDMCDRLSSRGVKFLQSNSTAHAVFDLYRHYNIFTINSLRCINGNPSGRSSIKEVLITNYDPF